MVVLLLLLLRLDGVSRTPKSDARFPVRRTWIEVRNGMVANMQMGGQNKRQAARCHRDLALM